VENAAFAHACVIAVFLHEARSMMAGWSTRQDDVDYKNRSRFYFWVQVFGLSTKSFVRKESSFSVR